MQRTYINPIYKNIITFLKTSAETGGQYGEADLILSAGGGNMPHYHTKFTEKFTAIEGVLGIQLATKKLFLNPGETYTVPIGTVHHFFNPGSEEIQFNIRITPGHEGFENAIRIGYGLARDGKTNNKGVPTNLSALALLFDLSDTHVPGLPTLLTPVFRWLAARARRNGLEQKLMDTYCQDMTEIIGAKQLA